MTDTETEDSYNKLAELKLELTSRESDVGDWQIARYNELLACGKIPPKDIAVLHEKRQAIRDKIAQLEDELGLSKKPTKKEKEVQKEWEERAGYELNRLPSIELIAMALAEVDAEQDNALFEILTYCASLEAQIKELRSLIIKEK